MAQNRSSFKGPGFGFQQPHGRFQLHETPVPQDPMSYPWASGTHMVHVHTCRRNKNTFLKSWFCKRSDCVGLPDADCWDQYNWPRMHISLKQKGTPQTQIHTRKVKPLYLTGRRNPAIFAGEAAVAVSRFGGTCGEMTWLGSMAPAKPPERRGDPECRGLGFTLPHWGSGR